MAQRARRFTGIAMAGLLVLAVACGKEAKSPPAAAPATTVKIVTDPATIGAYAQQSVTITHGQSVRWDWEDINPHTVTSDTTGGFDSGINAKGKTFTHIFDQAGSYAYHCTIHPSMHGTVVVQ